MKQYTQLSRPLSLAGITLKNRMLSAPTSLAELGADEHYSPANIEYYKLRAFGGCSLVTVGDVIVDLKSGRSHPQQVGINDPSAIPYLVAVADAIHSGGAFASVELDHGGALCAPEFIGGKNAIGPSAHIDPWGNQIEEMTEEDIYKIADAFAQGAAIAKDCGFDMVMIHAGHGWLLHQFISPYTNRRTDRWGGTLEKRMTLPLLVIEKVRKAVGHNFPIDIRISGTEYMTGGYEIDTGIEIAKMLDGKVDLVHVSAGTQLDEYSAVLMHPGIFQEHGANKHLAAQIKKHIKTPVCAVGAFSEPDNMESFLSEGGSDCIAMGRALIADPYLPQKVLTGRPEDITPCLRCGECQSGMIAKRVIRCTVNPLIGRESEFFHPIPTRKQKNILIAGGGPGGIQAALEAWVRGHKVTLCEQSNRPGGTLLCSETADFKYGLRQYLDSQVQKLMRSDIDLRLSTKVDQALVAEISPDVLIAAVGAKPIRLPIPGANGPQVIFGSRLTKESELGKNIVVIGGGLIGCEEALWLGRNGHNVIIIELQDTLAPDCGLMHRINLLHQLLAEPAIVSLTGHNCSKITDEGVFAKDSSGSETFFKADNVIIAVGMHSNTAGVEELRPLVNEFHVIGDANKAGQIMTAVRDAYNAIVRLGL